MLPVDSRLTHPSSYRHATRVGRRSGARTLATHLVVDDADRTGPSCPGGASSSARVGFVVSRAVGTAVVRNKVKRRLRHATRDRLGVLPPGALLVVRARPSAATATYAELVADLDRCLSRSLDPGGAAGRRVDR